jgi:hypothetical protein
MGNVDYERERDGFPGFEAQAASGAGRSSVVEQFDDRLRKAREIVERSNNRFSFRHPRFVDRYREGTCNVGLRRALADECQYGFVISAYPSGGDRMDRASPAGYSEKCRSRLDSKQSAMLAHDVELMEGPQKVIPSIIRFQRFDDVSFGRGKPLYAFETGERVDKVVEAAVNREVGFRVLTFAVARRERAGEDIQATANRVDVSPCLDIECQRQRLFFDRYYELVRNIRIRVFEGYFNIEMEPGVDPFVEGWELGYGPVNACLSV